MDKNYEKQPKKKACAHKTTGVQSKHKKQPSFATLGSDPFQTTFEDNDGRFRHSQWSNHFRQLCEYKVQFGNCLVPRKYAANPKLGRWVQGQRTRCRESAEGNATSITAERLRALNGIGFDWGTRSKTDLASVWNVRFQELYEFKAQFGHCRVPFKCATNPKLGAWVATQRTQYRRKTEEKSTSMTAERVRTLDGIGFQWGTRKIDLESVWSIRLQELRAFMAHHGHCMVTKQHSTNPTLGNWVTKQRTNYKCYHEGTPSQLTAERMRELESIGFKWEPHNGSWNEHFQQLRELTMQCGRSLVPINFASNPKLGQWVSTQRGYYRLYQEGKPGPMTAERIREIDSIGFDWGLGKTDLEAIWSVRFQQLCEFNVQFGHCVVPLRYTANPQLGNWVSKQRTQYKRRTEEKSTSLTAERIRQLESIGFNSEPQKKSQLP